MLRAKISALRLVYPPISNQEAAWLLRVPEVEERMRQSDFYMIGGRAEMMFEVPFADADSGIIDVRLQLTTGLFDKGKIHMRELPGVAGASPGVVALHAGPKFLKITDQAAPDGAKPLEWFTTEKLLFDRWRGRSGIYGFDCYREFANYELLYVGIASQGDSYDRVVASGHKKRLAILTNELQRFATSRVTDEVYLFLFAVEPLFISTFDLDHDFSNHDFEAMPVPAKQVVIDAEKAFIKLMDPRYNDVKYKGYPKAKQSLSRQGLDRYLCNRRGSHFPDAGRAHPGWLRSCDRLVERSGCDHGRGWRPSVLARRGFGQGRRGVRWSGALTVLTAASLFCLAPPHPASPKKDVQTSTCRA